MTEEEYVVLVQTNDDGTVVKAYGPFDDREAANIFAARVVTSCADDDDVSATVMVLENV